MAAFLGVPSVSVINTTLITGMDYLNKPQVYEQLIGRFPTQTELGWLKEYGMYEKVDGQSYNWGEENLLFDAPAIASFAQIASTNGVRVTLASASHYGSGKYSAPRPGNTTRFSGTSGLQGRVNVKSSAVDSAHTIDIYPSDNSISYATFTTGLAAGQSIMLSGLAFAEGSDGMKTAIAPTQEMFINYIQKFSDFWNITFEQSTNETWLSYTDPNTGETKKRVQVKGEGDTLDRFMGAIEVGLFTGSPSVSSPVDEDNAVLQTTKGAIPWLQDNGTLHQYSGALGQEYYDGLVKKFNNIHAGDTFVCGFGLNFGQSNRDFYANFGKAGTIVQKTPGSESILDLSFTKMVVDGYTIELKKMGVLNHRELTGAPGFPYPDYALYIPMQMTRDTKSGRDIKHFTVMYKEQYGEGVTDGGKYKIFETGAYATNGATSPALVRKRHYVCDFGLRLAGAKAHVLAYK